MRGDVCLTPLTRSAAPWLHGVATAYFAELVPDVPGPGMSEVEHWFADPDCHVMGINAGTEPAGFALIDRATDHHELAELCVLPPLRNAGIGTRAALACFARFPGAWLLAVASAQPGTARFWDRLLSGQPAIEGLARGPALTPYQSHSYTFTVGNMT